jgi:hypothetical protein
MSSSKSNLSESILKKSKSVQERGNIPNQPKTISELSSDDVWQLSYNSIDNISSNETIKQLLREKWKTLKENL